MEAQNHEFLYPPEIISAERYVSRVHEKSIPINALQVVVEDQ